MRQKESKSGFTIVELVIVIAVIAILAAILVPVISTIVNRAHVTKDTQLIRNLNTALAMDTQNPVHPTMQSALDAAAACGFDVEKINASAMNNMILWDSQNDVFCYLEVDDDGNKALTYIPESIKSTPLDPDSYKLWIISDTVDDNYSTYYTGNLKTITTTKGFDAGTTKDITLVEYNNNGTAQDVVIRTNGTSTTLKINDTTTGRISHYGEAGMLNIIQCHTASYHENGTVSFAEISTGRIVIEKNASFSRIHLNKKAAAEEFDEIIISYDTSVNLNDVDFTRDAVDIDVNGTLVVALQTGTEDITPSTALDYVWLTKQGIYEQAKVSDNDTSAGDVWVDTSDRPEETKIATQKIANKIGRDSNGEVEATTRIDEVDYIVTVDNETRDLVVKNANTDEVVEEAAIITESTDNSVAEAGLNATTKQEAKDEFASEAVNALVASEDPDYVFRIGSTGYKSLNAVNSAIDSSCMVYMLKDFEYSSGGIEFLQTVSNADVVVDLCGHTLKTGSWIDIHNPGGTTTFKNGTITKHAMFYISKANVHFVLDNIHFERTKNMNINKYIFFEQSDAFIEINNSTITGNNAQTDESLLGSFKGGERIIIKDTIVEWHKAQWVDEDASYNANKLSYIEFSGSSALYYSDSNISITANYETDFIGDNTIRYTLCASRATWVDHCASEFESIDDVNKEITIATAAQLGLLAKNVNAGTTYEGYTITLTADINLSDYDWVPIGYFDDSSKNFMGTFDGQNHTITGLKNTTQLTHKGVGLFGQVYAPAVIKNISVSGTIKSNKMYTGGIVGHGYAHLINCSFTGNVSGDMQVGGLCGSGGFTITNCSYSGNVSGKCWIGGITGNCQDGGAYTNCTVTGNVTAVYIGNIDGGVGTGVGYAGAGGIAGLTVYSTQVLDNCTFSGNIKESGVYVSAKLIGGCLE